MKPLSVIPTPPPPFDWMVFVELDSVFSEVRDVSGHTEVFTWVKRLQQVTCGSAAVLGSYQQMLVNTELMVTASSHFHCAVLRVGEHGGTS